MYQFLVNSSRQSLHKTCNILSSQFRCSVSKSLGITSYSTHSGWTAVSLRSKLDKLFSIGYRDFRCNSARKYSSFESQQIKVTKDIKVFTYDNSRLFRWITVFGLVQYFFWANFSYFCYKGLDGLEEIIGKSNTGDGGQGFWGFIIDFQTRYRKRIAVACMTLGVVVLSFSIIYPLRTVAALTLLKGGQSVRLSTYSFFGRIRHSEVPLTDISCRHSRAARGPQVSMKLRGRWFYYMLDKRDGQFLEPKIFDYVIGLNRFSK